MDDRLLARRLREAGFAVVAVAPAAGGAVAQAGLVTLTDGSRIFAKTLPELGPGSARPGVLNHGDLWTGNLVATAGGDPVLIDPAVSYTWAESDLSMVWSANRPPESDRFFAAYAELATLRDGWRERMPVLHLRELLSTIAHDDDDWGAVAAVREVIAPFRRR